jgi:hypothetical protein
MMRIGELLSSPARRNCAATPETDALVDLDALQEADLVNVRFDADDSSVVMLLDLRTALQFRLANTAVLVLRGVEELHWARGEHGGPGRWAHYVMSSKPGVDRDRVTLELVCLGGWRFSAISAAAEFFVGDIPDLPGAPPNFVEDDEQTITDGMPSWDSLFQPGWATFLDPMEPQAL